MKNAGRRKSHRFGLRAESFCTVFLRLKGYRILARRFKTPVGEIDVVARRGRCLVFAEIKARRNAASLSEAISPKNCWRVTRAAQYFLAGRPKLQEYDIRFDVLLVGAGFWPVHKKNAWQLDDLPRSV